VGWTLELLSLFHSMRLLAGTEGGVDTGAPILISFDATARRHRRWGGHWSTHPYFVRYLNAPVTFALTDCEDGIFMTVVYDARRDNMPDHTLNYKRIYHLHGAE
jgi:hypothetical protein